MITNKNQSLSKFGLRNGSMCFTVPFDAGHGLIFKIVHIKLNKSILYKRLELANV